MTRFVERLSDNPPELPKRPWLVARDQVRWVSRAPPQRGEAGED